MSVRSSKSFHRNRRSSKQLSSQNSRKQKLVARMNNMLLQNSGQIQVKIDTDEVQSISNNFKATRKHRLIQNPQTANVNRDFKLLNNNKGKRLVINANEKLRKPRSAKKRVKSSNQKRPLDSLRQTSRRKDGKRGVYLDKVEGVQPSTRPSTTHHNQNIQGGYLDTSIDVYASRGMRMTGNVSSSKNSFTRNANRTIDFANNRYYSDNKAQPSERSITGIFTQPDFTSRLDQQYTDHYGKCPDMRSSHEGGFSTVYHDTHSPPIKDLTLTHYDSPTLSPMRTLTGAMSATKYNTIKVSRQPRSQSSYAIRHNKQVQVKLSKINEMEHEQRISKDDDQNCKVLLKETDKEIQRLAYDVSKLVENGIRAIQPGHEMRLNIIEQTQMPFKVPCKDQQCPAKVVVKYHFEDEGQKKDLKITVNETQVHKNPTKFTVTNGKEPTFTEPYLYFSFFSLNGCKISIEITFKQSEDRALLRKKTMAGKKNKKSKGESNFEFIFEHDGASHKRYDELKLKIEGIQNNAQMYNDFMKYVVRLKNKRSSKQKKKKASKSHIKSNMAIIRDWQKFKQIKHLQNSNSEAQQIAQKRKQLMENIERKKKLFMLKRWDIVRDQRSEKRKIDLQTKRHALQILKWRRMRAVHFVYLFIFNRYMAKKRYEELKLLRIISSMKIVLSLRRRLRKYAPEQDGRYQNLIKGGITFTHRQWHDSYASRSKELVLKFVSNTSQIDEFSEGCMRFMKGVITLQKAFRICLVKKSARMEVVTMIWDTEYLVCLEKCQYGKGPKKEKKKSVAKLQAISTTRKLKMIEYYYLYATVRYKYCFAQYKALKASGGTQGLSKVQKKMFQSLLSPYEQYLFKVEDKEDFHLDPSSLPEKGAIKYITNKTNVSEFFDKIGAKRCHSPYLRRKPGKGKKSGITSVTADEAPPFCYIPTREILHYMIKQAALKPDEHFQGEDGIKQNLVNLTNEKGKIQLNNCSSKSKYQPLQDSDREIMINQLLHNFPQKSLKYLKSWFGFGCYA